MNAQSYLIVKPDGLDFTSEILSILTKEVRVTRTIQINDFCQLAPELYLDEEACKRGNHPIIWGINTIWKMKFKQTSALLILVESLDSSLNENEFISKVCSFKKNFRKQKFPKGYIEYFISPESIYEEFNGNIPENNLLEKRLDKNGFYRLQLNCLHCPDSEEAYQREMSIIKNYLFTKKIVKALATV